MPGPFYSEDAAWSRANGSQFSHDPEAAGGWYNGVVADTDAAIRTHAGWYFPDIDLDPEEVIPSATLTVYWYAIDSTYGWMNADIGFEDADDAASFDADGQVSDRSLQTTSHEFADVATANLVLDITESLQEMVDRPGWVNGNALMLLMQGRNATRPVNHNGWLGLKGLPLPFWEGSRAFITIGDPPAVEQHRLMLSDGIDPDVANVNITEHAKAAGGDILVRFERGRQRAVAGEPPVAASMAVTLENPNMSRYALDTPRPGRALRLNKFIESVAYQMCQVNVTEAVHTREGDKPVVQLSGIGTLAKLAGKKVSTALYKGITTGAAFEAVLAAAGVSENLRDIDTGEVTLRYFWVHEEDALTALQRITNSEGITAEFFEQADGTIRFLERSGRFGQDPAAEFTAIGTPPNLADFQYFSGGDEVVNYASHERIARVDDDSPSVVWQDSNGSGFYNLVPDQPLVFVATAEEPFFDAITPEEDTDYGIVTGSVSVALDRTSGQSVRITFTAGGGGASIGPVGAEPGITLRATKTIVGATFIEVSSIDATVSRQQHGLQSWDGEMSKEMDWADMRDNLDAIVAWKQTPVGRVRIKVLALTSAEANLAIATLDISNLIVITAPYYHFNGSGWIERIEHEVHAPAGLAEADGALDVGREYTWYECLVSGLIDDSMGSGAGASNPYDSIDNGGFIEEGS